MVGMIRLDEGDRHFHAPRLFVDPYSDSSDSNNDIWFNACCVG